MREEYDFSNGIKNPYARKIKMQEKESYDLSDVCQHMKGFIMPAVPDDFIVAEPFRHGLSNHELIAGVNAFRLFLGELFDNLGTWKNHFDPKKAALFDPENGEESIWKCFPVIKDLTALLFFIGLHGKLETEPNVTFTVYGSDLLDVPKPKSEKFYGLKKLSGKRLADLFEFLSEMSFYFEELDYSDKVDLGKIGVFYISYENDRDLLIGLKLLAEAQSNIKSKHYRLETFFMRSDYRPLYDMEPRKYQVRLIDCFNTGPPDINKWLTELDEFLRKNGCRVSADGSGSNSIDYINRKSKQWVLKVYIDVTGCRVRPNVFNLLHNNRGFVELPEAMLQILREKSCSNCYGNQPCLHGGAFKFTQNGENFAGCRSPQHRGYKFTLDDEDSRQALREWIEKEIS